MKYVLQILLAICALSTHAQVADGLNQDVGPKYGVNQLAIEYYGIEFTTEQRAELENVQIEFIYSVDKYGDPTLSEVNGITNQEIIDSLLRKTEELENFNPLIRDGEPVPSIYFMKLTFPSYKDAQRVTRFFQAQAYNEARLEDFEYLHESGSRLDMVVGGLMSQFVGNPSRHLGIGGGMKVELNYSTPKGIFYGMNISFSFNGLKEEYPIATQREQISPASAFLGLSVGKWFSKYSIQLDLDFAIHNITEKIGDNDPDWVQLNGWSPGVIFNYPIALGRERPMYYWGAPSLIGNNINLSLGLRYVSHSLPEASGLMIELGVGYRMALKKVTEYKLKDGF